MIHSRLLSFAFVVLLLFFRCAPISAATLTNNDARILASAYLEAEFDERSISYQIALSQLEFIKVLDGVLTKVRPSQAMTISSPAWKVARSELLAQILPVLTSFYARERMQKAYQTAFANSLSSEEANKLLSLLSSEDGKQYFRAIRLLERKRVIERYILTVATSRPSLPEPIASQIVRNDMEQLSREDKDLGRPDREVNDRLKAIAEDVAWKKLIDIPKTAALETLKDSSAGEHFNDIRESMKQIVKKAINNFNASKDTKK